MRYLLILLIMSLGAEVFAQDQGVPAGQYTPTAPVVLSDWKVSKVPWDDWFKKNTTVTDKTDHVHFFWNAQDFKANFEVKDKKQRLAQAALQLVARLYPEGAKSDAMRVDIVYVLERDTYGMPKWDSMQQVAHLEFSRAKITKLAKSDKPLTDDQMKKVFSKFEIY